jgi:hypothetical protein
MVPESLKLQLKCPNCGALGEARLWEQNSLAPVRGPRTRLEFFPKGFKAVRHEDSRDDVHIFCEKCDVSAQA